MAVELYCEVCGRPATLFRWEGRELLRSWCTKHRPNDSRCPCCAAKDAEIVALRAEIAGLERAVVNVAKAHGLDEIADYLERQAEEAAEARHLASKGSAANRELRAKADCAKLREELKQEARNAT